MLIRDLFPGDRADDGGAGGEADGRAGARRGRFHVLWLGALATAAALVSPGLVQMLELVAAVYSVALFCPLLVGHYWDGATGPGALASMAASGVVGLLHRRFGGAGKPG